LTLNRISQNRLTERTANDFPHDPPHKRPHSRAHIRPRSRQYNNLYDRWRNNPHKRWQHQETAEPGDRLDLNDVGGC
jgi:hypothetical protein